MLKHDANFENKYKTFKKEVCSCMINIHICESDKHDCVCPTTCKSDNHSCICVQRISWCRKKFDHKCICPYIHNMPMLSTDMRFTGICKSDNHVCICSVARTKCMKKHLCFKVCVIS
jgi:hypothetical protein